MIILIVTYTVQPGKEQQAEEYVRKMQKNTRREPGCRFYAGHRSKDNPSRICFYEQYDDEAALEAHRAAPYFAEYITDGLARIIEPASRVQETYSPIE